MKSITSILVPVNFTEVAASAFQYALRLADDLDARIDLLYCIPPTTANPGYGSFVNTLSTTLQEDATRDMAQFFQEGVLAAATALRDVPAVRTFIRFGDLRYVVRNFVGEEGNELIVMGTRGGHDSWDDLFGTNSSFLVARAPCPVIVVPYTYAYTPLRKVCYATDLQHVDVFKAGNVLRMLRPFRPNVHFFHLQRAEEDKTAYDLELLRKVFDRPDGQDRTFVTSWVGSDVATAIFKYAEEQSCDLVVMNRPERSWLDRLLRPSNTKQAVIHATRPLLVVGSGELLEDRAVTPDTATETAD